MTISATLAEMVNALDREKIPYMLTGSLATSYHGTPRATQDINFVIHPSRAQLERLVTSFPVERFYVDRQSAVEAVGAKRVCQSERREESQDRLPRVP